MAILVSTSPVRLSRNSQSREEDTWFSLRHACSAYFLNPALSAGVSSCLLCGFASIITVSRDSPQQSVRALLTCEERIVPCSNFSASSILWVCWYSTMDCRSPPLSVWKTSSHGFKHTITWARFYISSRYKGKKQKGVRIRPIIWHDTCVMIMFLYNSYDKTSPTLDLNRETCSSLGVSNRV